MHHHAIASSLLGSVQSLIGEPDEPLDAVLSAMSRIGNAGTDCQNDASSRRVEAVALDLFTNEQHDELLTAVTTQDIGVGSPGSVTTKHIK